MAVYLGEAAAMTGKELRYVDATVENEGFDYAFVHYTDFKNIKDEKFHELREAFLKARQELIDYCGLENC